MSSVQCSIRAGTISSVLQGGGRRGSSGSRRGWWLLLIEMSEMVTIMHDHHHRRRHHHCLQRSHLQTCVVESLWSRCPRRWQLWSYNEVLLVMINHYWRWIRWWWYCHQGSSWGRGCTRGGGCLAMTIVCSCLWPSCPTLVGTLLSLLFFMHLHL